jgi:CubicO group peptidase (beta-lactamase class C family)
MRDKRTTLYSLLLLTSTLLVVALRAARTAAQPPLDLAAIDQFIAGQMAVQRVPGLALAIAQGDQVLYVKGYGTAGQGQPMTPQAQFFLASVSKSFTALAVMQLVEARQIDLDLPVQTYLPGFTLADPAAASQITVRHLLNQTSGLADSGLRSEQPPQHTTLAAYVADLRTARPVAPPGREFHYTDANYALLARVVEVVSGEPFSAYLETHIFAPLEMVHTFHAVTSDEAKQQAGQLAQGHLVAYGMPLALGEMSGFVGGAAGVISTAAEMANYLIMHSNGGRFQGGQLLAPESLAVMHRPPTNIDTPYAMGWVETTYNGRRLLEHNGILSVYFADVVMLPERGLGLALLYNVSSLATVSVAVPAIRDGLLALLQGEQPPPVRLTVTWWAVLMALITLIGVALAVRSLLRLPRWAEQTLNIPVWRLVFGIAWAFVPAGALLALPTLITASAGRAFGYTQLLRSMPEIFLWLGLCGVLGVINAAVRIGILSRRTRK